MNINSYRVKQLIDKVEKLQVNNMTPEEIQKSFTKEEQDILKVAMTKIQKSEDNEIIKSLNNILEKSHISDFTYSDRFSVNKTGKEIKERLTKIYNDERLEQTELKLKFNNLLEKISEAPEKDIDYWRIDGYIDRGIDSPKIFNCYQLVDSSKTNTIEDNSSLKSEYDELVKKYIDSQKECIQINTMLNNFKDSDIYKLTVNQATILGF